MSPQDARPCVQAEAGAALKVSGCLGFAAHDIPVLIANKLLKPLGNPPPNGGRYFAGSEVDRLRLDTKWLDKASALLVKHWKTKNDRKSDSLRKPTRN